MKVVPIAKLENAIIKPGIEKFLHPLIHFRGAWSLGRAHRIWNFAQSMKAQECETSADGTVRLALNPAFSHLAGPQKRPDNTALRALASRLAACPTVQALDPELYEYIRDVFPYPFQLQPIPEVTYDTKSFGVDNWRLFYSKRAEDFFTKEEWEQYKHDQALKRLETAMDKQKRAARRVADALRSKDSLVYPFLIHDGGKPEHDLLKLVNNAVPKYLLPETRADVCQDLIVGILSGDFDKDNLNLPAKEMLKRVQKMFPTKYGPLSLDAIVEGTENMRLIDRVSEYDGLWNP